MFGTKKTHYRIWYKFIQNNEVHVGRKLVVAKNRADAKAKLRKSMQPRNIMIGKIEEYA